ncbi:hypothetical protein [Dyella nitratireducens]|uniref:Uncharacterized protein n=1 Tax=Dyella nitratireducens TaxID=1849580 RepID=A0ABQ1GWP2_9GAMM|nr:hypothetical protein [Dyella nitratireducens]GGA51844.1 hypothetical protein GCM10010981_46590 [Dyella nitratireducens]GLQ41650.1 hypothetical protein GCM10007902_15000 [Dyella nitratireducens]
MTFDQAMGFIREHGIVLSAACGPVPRMAEVIAGEPIKGSWWAHPKSHEIFRVFQQLAESPEILVCRLVDGKVTFVHRRLWPALVRLADRFEPAWLAQVYEEHTAKGHHEAHEVPYPQWVPADVLEEAKRLGAEQALSMLGPVVLPK